MDNHPLENAPAVPASEYNAAPSHTTVPPATAPASTGPTSESSPTANGNVSATLQNAKDTVVNKAEAALSAVQNNQTVKDIANGPMVQNVKEQTSKVSAEFQDLANSKTVPTTPAATGQPLTQYHSLFYRLLSWENPRATATSFGLTILFIFAARYLNVLKYALKGTYFILGVISVIEITGKLLFDDGLASRMRPRRYWTIPRESLERSLEDVEQLLNFFVIEVQRIVWAENIVATAAAFSSALVSYWLIKLVPIWGVSLIGTCVLYLIPLIYVKNRKAIDDGIEEVSNVISSQASQIKNITAEHTGKATESIKSYTNEYTQKAQELMGSNKTSVSPNANASNLPTPPKEEPVSVAAPAAPTNEPLPVAAEHETIIAH